MRNVVSKQVVATRGQPGFLEQEWFNNIRTRLTGGDDPKYHRRDEYNKNKKNTDLGGFGSNERGQNSGAGVGLGRDEKESRDPRNPTSGYNDGGRADDEIGPGHKDTQGPVKLDGENVNVYNDLNNELFMDLSLKGQGKNDSILRHYKSVLYGPTVTPLRVPVDKSKQGV